MSFEVRLYVGVGNELKENGYSIKEQEQLYDSQLDDLFNRTRWYLDNLDFLPTYRVSWKNYRYNTPVLPYKFTRKGGSL